MADENRTKFDYLLNAFERASQADVPADYDYYGKRMALFEYVRDLERKASPAASQELSPGQQQALERHRRQLSTLPQTREQYEALHGTPARKAATADPESA